MSEKIQKEPQLTLAESARTLVASNNRGILGTLDPEDGSPYTSIVDLLPLDNGEVAMFLSSLAEHRKYLDADPRASVLIAPYLYEPDVLSRPRLTLMGRVEHVAHRETLIDPYLASHPDAEPYIHFADFQFFRLSVSRVRYIAGFGRMGWMDAEAYQTAKPDLLYRAAGDVIGHMNADHAHNLRDYAHAFCKLPWAEAAEMTHIDRYGFDLVVQGGEQIDTARVSFEEPLTSPGQVRQALVQMAENARKILNK